MHYHKHTIINSFRKLEELGDYYVYNGYWDVNYITSIGMREYSIEALPYDLYDLIRKIFEEGYQYLETLLFDSYNDLNLKLAFELRYKISSIMKGVIEQNTAVIAYYDTVIYVGGDYDMVLDNLIKIY